MDNLKSHLYFLSFCVLIFTQGCAQTLQIDSINPDLNINTTTKLTGNSKTAIESFKIHSKAHQYIVGEAKVGFVNSKADIVSTEEVGSIVANAVKKGFRAAGFHVVDLRDADFIVSGVVEKFWVDEYATGLSLEFSKASVRYDVIIRDRHGATIWANSLDLHKTSDESLDATEDDIPTLSLALKESVESIFRDQSFWGAIYKYDRQM